MAIVSGWPSPAAAVPSYLTAFRSQYPAAVGTRIDACSLCHTAIPQRNPYGDAFRNAGFDFVPIEADDSDGDAVTNLAEIIALTFPGDAADVPPPAPTPTATPAPPTCAGDCDASGTVTVDELLRAVNVALGIAGIDVCSVADRDGDGVIAISELLTAVNNALDGCPVR